IPFPYFCAKTVRAAAASFMPRLPTLPDTCLSLDFMGLHAMKDRMFLEPAGVASRLFPACETAPRRSRTQQNAAHLLAAAENHDLDPAITYLACELVDLQPDLSDAESRALLCLVLISLFQQRQGSTYLPLDPAE